MADITCYKSEYTGNWNHCFSEPTRPLPWYKQTPRWSGTMTCDCRGTTSRSGYRDLSVFKRLPHWAQFILCKARFPRGCPHIFPGQRWSAR